MPDNTPADRNQAMIEQFRANDGVVDAPFPVALVHHKGAKSGVERITPLAMQEVDDGFAVFAAKRGADDNPAWYYNLLANPVVTVEVGTETYDARAHEAQGEEYERIWNKQKTDYPTYAGYEQQTKRSYIPVIVLKRA